MRILTHKAWFLFCPIYMTPPNQGEVRIIPRRALLQPVFELCMGIQLGYINAVGFFVPGYDPDWFIWHKSAL